MNVMMMIVGVMVGLFLVVLGVYGALRRHKNAPLPKGWRPVPPGVGAPVRSRSEDCARDRFLGRKVPAGGADVVVVGSGISGLMCAALLARLGKVVVVMEQHDVAGGCCHSFLEGGVTFDSGIHYVGKAHKYRALLDLVSAGPAVQWEKLGTEADGYVYDRIVVAGEEFPFRAGHEAFLQDLQQRFPEESEALVRYMDMVRRCNRDIGIGFESKIAPAWIRSLVQRFALGKYRRWASMTAEDAFDACGLQSPLLRTVLAGQYGDIGLVPSKASFAVHAGVVSHYLSGGYFPVGGSEVIARALIPTIEAAGGRVLVKAPVCRINVVPDGEGGGVKATGVVLEDGTEVLAREGVVSAAGLLNTFQRLMDPALLDFCPGLQPYTDAVSKLSSSVGHVCCFITLDGTVEELQLQSCNFWCFPFDKDEEDFDLDAMTEAFEADPFESGPMMLFIGFPSAKDPAWTERFPANKNTAVIIGAGKASWFEEWKDKKTRKRGPEYESLKKRLGDRMLEEGLFKHFPHLRGKILHCEISTPLSTQFFLGNEEGESYGLEHTPERFAGAGLHIIPKVEAVKGLYLTGQDVVTAGFAGAMMSGVLTAMSFAGYGTFADIASGRNLILDLMRLPPLQSSSKDD